MNIESIAPALVGGAIIGLAASALLLFSGRIMGISGILSGLVRAPPTDRMWRYAFFVGLLGGGALVSVLLPGAIQAPEGRSMPTIMLAGLLVGIGTRMGSGCTSGHGVCGLARLSRRSIVATVAFLASGIVTATLLSVSGG